MLILYDIAFIIFGILYLPYLIITKRYRYGMRDRIGIVPEHIKSISSKGKIIWIHAVSVGEMKAASILAPLLRKILPSHTLIFSSITHTGNKVAKTIAKPNEGVFYLPFDLSFIVKKVVQTIKPELFLSLETELWPNLINCLSESNAKIILINGRLSEKSYAGYKRFRFIFSRILKKFSLILMQSEKDASRILALGAPKDKVFVTGNLKFDLSLLESTNKRLQTRQMLNLNEKDILLVAGSTHKGEEKQIIDCFSKLEKEYGNLKLLIAPRHIERTKQVAEIINRYGFVAEKFSDHALRNTHACPPKPSTKVAWRRRGARRIYILDTIGELKTLYSASDIVFVGGSLVRKGGQNPIEPASLSMPVIFGKFTFNFQDVVRAFVENKACIQVQNKDELYSVIKLLLDRPKERKRLGINARNTVQKNSGSSQRTIDIILSLQFPYFHPRGVR